MSVTAPNYQSGNDLPVAYAHKIDYFSKGIDERGPFYMVRYYIDNWSDTDLVVNALLGYIQNTAGSGGNTLKVAPHQYPLSTNLFCVSAKVDGEGPPSLNAAGYPIFGNGRYVGGASITAEYRPMIPYDYVQNAQTDLQQLDPTTPLLWCTQELDFSTELYTIASTQVTWSAGPQVGKPLQNYPFRIRVPLAVLNLIFHKIPYMPAGPVKSLQGFVNSATFLACPAGSLYFAGGKIVRDFNTDGTVCQKLMMTFSQRTITAAPAGAPAGATGQLWNSLPSPVDLQWYPVNGPNAGLLYPTGSFAPLALF